MIVPILYDSRYNKAASWRDKIKTSIESALAQKKYSCVTINGDSFQSFDFDSIFVNSPRLVLMVANKPAWTFSALEFMREKNINVVLVDYCAITNSIVKGQVSFNFEQDLDTVLSYLSQHGCNRTALYGTLRTAFSDNEWQKHFIEKMSQRGITDTSAFCFENIDGLANCYKSFRNRVPDFDSVICTNEIAANALIQKLTNEGIRVPEDLRVVAFSFTELAYNVNPSLSILKLDHNIIGQQAVMAFRYLYNANNPNVQLNLSVCGKILNHEDIDNFRNHYGAFNRIAFPLEKHTFSFDEDDEVIVFSKIEKLLTACDETDIKLLKCIINNMPYECIANDLHLSRGSVFYRIKRLKEAIGKDTLNDFKDFLLSQHFDKLLTSYLTQ